MEATGAIRSPDALNRLIEVALAEFAALRAEIATRARSQEQYMTLGLTAASAVGGLVVGGSAERPLLLVIVIVGPLLGFLFLDHAQTVDALGDHIREILAPAVRNAVRQLASDQTVVSQAELAKLLAWEDKVRERRRMAGWRGLMLGPSLLPFAIVPGAAAAFVSNTDGTLSPAAYWVLWSVGLSFIVLYLVLWLLWVVKYR